MKISIHSEKYFAETGIEWFRGGTNITYLENKYPKSVNFFNDRIFLQMTHKDIIAHCRLHINSSIVMIQSPWHFRNLIHLLIFKCISKR